MAVYAMLNVPHGMGYPARMPVVPNRNEVVAVSFNTLCYDASVGVLNSIES